MEHVRPEFPGAFALGLDLPVDPDIAKVFQTVRASSGPVRFGPASEHPLPAEAAKRFSIQSMIAMAIYPKGDKPYMLGAAPVLVPASLDTARRAAFPGDRPAAGRRSDQLIDVSQPGRKRAQAGRGPEPRARRLLGARHRYGSHHLVGRNLPHLWAAPAGTDPKLAQLPELVHPEDKQIVVKAVAEALRGGPRYDVEYRVVRPNGEVRLVP
mgnify:CR=1 FL=1